MNTESNFLQKKDAFLLVVDIQKSVLDTCFEPDRIVKNISNLIDVIQLIDMPVIYSEQNADKLGRTIPELLEKVPASQVFNKMEFGCFQNETLSNVIEKTNRKTVILTGIQADVCIFQTGLQALERGYKVHVIADAVSSPRELDWRIGLRRLEKAGAIISSTEMVIFELLNRAGTSEFKRALPFLKNLS
jgi:nicotinamidase-related amidase